MEIKGLVDQALDAVREQVELEAGEEDLPLYDLVAGDFSSLCSTLSEVLHAVGRVTKVKGLDFFPVGLDLEDWEIAIAVDKSEGWTERVKGIWPNRRVEIFLFFDALEKGVTLRRVVEEIVAHVAKEKGK